MASGSARLGSVWHFSAQISPVELGEARPARLGSARARPRSARLGSARARLGSARLVLARLGSVRHGAGTHLTNYALLGKSVASQHKSEILRIVLH